MNTQNKTIIYFHGYNSSPNSRKIARLRREPNFTVYAFQANIDPDIAINEVSSEIDLALVNDLHSLDRVIFVGTSLGGWLAATLAEKYGTESVIINPSVDPRNSLLKYGVSEEIAHKYEPMPLLKTSKFFFAENDDVIDNKALCQHLMMHQYNVSIVSNADHSFNGQAFETVISHLQKC